MVKVIDKRQLILAILHLLKPEKRDIVYVEAAYIIAKEELRKLGYEIR